MDHLRALRVYLRVVDEGSFAGAARALDLAPAVVTRSVAELERHLGTRLLNRTTRALALTDAGRDYAGHARRILDELDDADAQAGQSARVLRGILRVRCPPAFAVHALAAVLPAWHTQHPEVALEVVANAPVTAVDEYHDVSIVAAAGRPLDGDYVARRIARSAFVLCASPAYLARRGRPRSPDALLGHDALLPAVASVRRELTLIAADGTEATFPTPEPVLATAQLELLHAAALAGLGIAGVPSFVAAAALADGRLERVLPSWRGVWVELHAAVPTRRHLPARTRAFVDFLVAAFGGEADPWLKP